MLLNKLCDYKYKVLKGYSYSWLKYLIYMWKFIEYLKTATDATIAALTDTHTEKSSGTQVNGPGQSDPLCMFTIISIFFFIIYFIIGFKRKIYGTFKKKVKFLKINDILKYLKTVWLVCKTLICSWKLSSTVMYKILVLKLLILHSKRIKIYFVINIGK